MMYGPNGMQSYMRAQALRAPMPQPAPAPGAGAVPGVGGMMGNMMPQQNLPARPMPQQPMRMPMPGPMAGPQGY